jgi:death-on-curing family protein
MLGPDYVEHIHDQLVVKLWPGSDPVDSLEYRDRGLIESAVHRPFQSAFGQDAYPTVLDKATALFHSLASNHAFHNGNKRTAVIALQHFLLANDLLLTLSNNFLYQLAERTASYRERGLSHDAALREIDDTVGPGVVAWQDVREALQRGSEFYRATAQARRRIRRDKRNRLIPSE